MLDSNDIELKFSGKPIDALGGAPAELMVASLTALQQLAHLIGMKEEGRAFGQRAKPSAKVRRDYAVICRPSQHGSHIQPISLANASGRTTPAAIEAGRELLRTLNAFDSGDPDVLQQVIPDARQRWFMAKAASGLLPAIDSEIEVTLRFGSHGQFGFHAARARGLIDKYRAGDPPAAQKTTLVGKLKALDFSSATMTLQPAKGRMLKVQYPLQVEPFLQRNVRKRLSLTSDAEVNESGDIVRFQKIERICELEPSSKQILAASSGGSVIKASRPLSYNIVYDFDCHLFTVNIDQIGVDVFSSNFEDIEHDVLADLGVLWRNYAQSPDEALTPDAVAAKAALNLQFVESR